MLILASASPRRHELLIAAGLPHIIRAAGIDESRFPSEPAVDYVKRMARQKAGAVQRNSGETILAADTVVAVDGEIFGKPRDDSDAARMLHSLAARVHSVFTGICLLGENREIVQSAETRVTFSPLTEQEIRSYVESGEPRDKAGAYAIQGAASKFISSIEGCYQNVVGLPISLVYRHLKTL